MTLGDQGCRIIRKFLHEEDPHDGLSQDHGLSKEFMSGRCTLFSASNVDPSVDLDDFFQLSDAFFHIFSEHFIAVDHYGHDLADYIVLTFLPPGEPST
jgi:hypothetical protein